MVDITSFPIKTIVVNPLDVLNAAATFALNPIIIPDATRPVSNYQLTADSVNQAYIIQRTNVGGHLGQTLAVNQTEMKADGSGANGSQNATIGNSIRIAKTGYAGGSAATGEIDALEIFVRQDGPDGYPSADPLSSDASAIMINAQNAGTCGFISVMDATSSNILRSGVFPIDLSMQVQIGVIDANNVAGKVGYGFAAVAKVGTPKTAFHAGATGGTWENLFDSPKVKATWAGEIIFKDAAHATFAGKVARTSGENGTLQIVNRGAGGISITNTDAANISFAIAGATLLQITQIGEFRPFSNGVGTIGSPSRRWAAADVNALTVHGASILASSLPVYEDNATAVAGGLAVGRVYRSSAGAVRVVI